MLKIGALAKKTGVSVRSLRHYDKIGLLQPKACSDAGYRLYSKEDVCRLQQIVSLKQMKIPLQKIKAMLLEDSMTLRETLEMQEEFLQQQLTQHHKICKNVEQLLTRLSNQDTISLELICTTMENIKMLEKYYTAEQLQELEQRNFNQNEEEGQAYAKAWTDVFTGLDALRLKGIPATDEKAKPFALKSRELFQAFSAGNQAIEQSVRNMQQQEGGAQMLRNHGLEVSDALYAYYEAAIQAHTNTRIQ